MTTIALLKAIQAKDFVTAGKVLEGILSEKVSDKIEEMRVAVGAKLFKMPSLTEMCLSSSKSKSGKKVEWFNMGGDKGHFVTVNGKPAHTGMVDGKSAADIHKKALED